MKKQIAIILAVGGVAIAAFFVFQDRSTPEMIAKKGLEAMISADFDRIKPYTGDELRLLGLTEDQARDMVHNFIGPYLSKLKLDGDIVVASSPAQESATASTIFISGDQRFTCTSTAERKQGQLQLDRSISTFALVVITMKNFNSEIEDKRLRVLKAVETSRGELEKYGLKGIVQGEKFVTWDEFLLDIRERVAKRPYVPKPRSG